MPQTRFTRDDVVRILRISPTRLSQWQRQGLCAVAESFSFQELSHLRILRDLATEKVSVASIRASIAAMKQASGMSNPLGEATAVASGRRVAFRHGGMVVDPIEGQFLFDFDLPQQHQISLVQAQPASRDTEISRMFAEAVQLESRPETHAQAMAAYASILAAYPTHAPSAINLGTLYYNQRNYAEAEKLYRRATEADANYALAFFDLGNVLDELRRLPEAVIAYKRAIELVPGYADAHYNLALTLERMGQARRALKHWAMYVKLDAAGPWASHARGQIARTLHSEPLKVVFRNAGARPLSSRYTTARFN